MADKRAPRESELATSIRTAASKVGGLEKLRKLTKLSNGTFYSLLSGWGDRTPTIHTFRKLKKAGVELPEDFLDAA